MEFGSTWADGALGFLSWIFALAAAALMGVVRRLLELRARYPELLSPQTLFGLIGTGIGIWRWWESREARLFRQFERMIEGVKVPRRLTIKRRA